MVQLSRTVRRPIAMFVDESDAALIQAFADVGVSASVVEEKARSGQFSISASCASTPLQDPGTRLIAPNPRGTTARWSIAPSIPGDTPALTEERAYVCLRYARCIAERLGILIRCILCERLPFLTA